MRIQNQFAGNVLPNITIGTRIFTVHVPPFATEEQYIVAAVESKCVVGMYMQFDCFILDLTRQDKEL